MQIFEQKSTTKMAYLYTLQNTIFQRTHARMRYCLTIRQLRQLNINFNQLFILALYQVVSSIVGSKRSAAYFCFKKTSLLYSKYFYYSANVVVN